MGLYFSLLLKRGLPEGNVQLISLLASLALKAAVEKSEACDSDTTFNIDIKWPNDLLIGGRKIAGILVETVTQGDRCDIVIGIGLNVLAKASDFSPSLRETAASLAQFYPGEWDLRRLLKGILGEFENRVNAFNPPELLEQYRSQSRIWGKPCRVETAQGEIAGVCRDVGENGELIVDTGTGPQKILSGTLYVEW